MEKKTVGALLGFLAGQDTEAKIDIWGTTNDDGTGSISIEGGGSFHNY